MKDFFKKLLGITRKVGETALEIGEIALHVDQLEDIVRRVATKKELSTSDVELILMKTASIKSAVVRVSK